MSKGKNLTATGRLAVLCAQPRGGIPLTTGLVGGIIEEPFTRREGPTPF